MKKSCKYAYTTILIILLITLQACAHSNSDSTSEIDLSSTTIILTEPASSYPGGYPAPGFQEFVPQAYPEPEQIEDNDPIVVEAVERPLDLPAPKSGYATIGGVIVNEGTNQPPPESLLYLAPLLYSDQGLPVVSLDRQTDPVAILPSRGLFVFENVEPGEYSLVFFTPDYSFLIEDKDSGNSLILTVTADEVLDLDLLEISNR
jgi:hypothetical protein